MDDLVSSVNVSLLSNVSFNRVGARDQIIKVSNHFSHKNRVSSTKHMNKHVLVTKYTHTHTHTHGYRHLSGLVVQI